MNKKPALDFATNYLELQTRHWGGYQAMMRYHLFSEALTIALDEQILSEKDFHKDEPFVLNKVEKSQNKRIKEILVILKKKDPKDIKGNLGKKIVKKFRYVDPKVILNRKLFRLSKLIPKFETIIDKHREINKKGLVV